MRREEPGSADGLGLDLEPFPSQNAIRTFRGPDCEFGGSSRRGSKEGQGSSMTANHYEDTGGWPRSRGAFKP
jgi:hypothetical protein